MESRLRVRALAINYGIRLIAGPGFSNDTSRWMVQDSVALKRSAQYLSRLASPPHSKL